MKELKPVASRVIQYDEPIDSIHIKLGFYVLHSNQE